MGMNALPDNMFHVTSISDDKRLGDKGMMQVTDSELIYTDRRTATSWKWPLKFLRKYGCDGEVFSFEAGRKCPGGEGLYAFSAKRASQIFDMVARNINQGGLQPPAGELSPFPSESHPPDLNTLISHRNSSQSPTHNHTDQPNYANMDLSGAPLVQVETGIDPTLPLQRPVAYKEVVFDRPSEQHPVPKDDKEPRMSYTRVDFAKTDQFNHDRKLGPLPEMPPYIPQSRPTTSSVSGPPTSRGERSGKRSRIHTYSGPGGSTGRSLSESSFSSQGSLTESTRDVRPSLSTPMTGAAGHSHVSLDGTASGTALYQNVVVTNEGSGATSSMSQAPQQQYQNVSVGAGSVSQVFNTPQQMTNGHSTHTSRSASQSGTKMSRGIVPNGISPVVVNGNPMAHYADLELSARKRATSTPVGTKAPPNLSYSVMEFNKEGKLSPSHNSPSSSSCVPQPSVGSSSPLTKTINGENRGRHLPSISSKPEDEPLERQISVTSTGGSSATTNGQTKTVQDETKVEYGVLNFPVMATLEKMKGEHLKAEDRQHDSGHGTNKKSKK